MNSGTFFFLITILCLSSRSYIAFNSPESLKIDRGFDLDGQNQIPAATPKMEIDFNQSKTDSEKKQMDTKTNPHEDEISKPRGRWLPPSLSIIFILIGFTTSFIIYCDRSIRQKVLDDISIDQREEDQDQLEDENRTENEPPTIKKRHPYLKKGIVERLVEESQQGMTKKSTIAEPRSPPAKFSSPPGKLTEPPPLDESKLPMLVRSPPIKIPKSEFSFFFPKMVPVPVPVPPPPPAPKTVKPSRLECVPQKTSRNKMSQVCQLVDRKKSGKSIGRRIKIQTPVVKSSTPVPSIDRKSEKSDSEKTGRSVKSVDVIVSLPRKSEGSKKSERSKK